VKDLDLVGIGSIVVDTFCRVDSLLAKEGKTFIRSRKQLLGGVTLNHVSWAASLGLKASVVGVGSDDDQGRYLRRGLDRLGVDHSGYFKTGDRTAACQIFVDRQGERAIYMDSGPTGTLRPKNVGQFLPWFKRSQSVSTEISQLKLATVCQVLSSARQAGCRTFLDLDLPPSQATGSAGLGSRAELDRALGLADCLKSSQEAASELVPQGKPEAMALALHKKLKKKAGAWVALTAGSKGSALSDGKQALFIPAAKVRKVVDTTGAGDAYLGGMIAGTLKGLPLAALGRQASRTAANCVGQLGATPLVDDLDKGTDGVDKPAFIDRAIGELQGLSSKVSPEAYTRAIQLILDTERKGGIVHATGIGKSEHVAQYAAASFSSTGTPCFFLHGTEVLHGSSGQVRPGDLVLAVSRTGETHELREAVQTLKVHGARVLGVSGNPQSWLAKNSDVFLYAGVGHEGDSLGLAPRASILAQILVLASLGVALQEKKKFRAQDFQKHHPNGVLKDFLKK
jgi:arabinose-5-phosphate isomerase